MKFGAFVLALSVGATHVAGGATSVTPVQKVVQLLEGMLAKGKQDKHEEAVQYATYKQFCDDTDAKKTRSIAQANQRMEVLTADLEKFSTTAAKLTREVAEHEGDIAAWTGDMKATTRVRDMDKAAYDAMHEDLSESVDALQRALEVLKRQAYTRAQAPQESFAQVAALTNLKLISKEAEDAISLFLAQDDPDAGSAEGLDVRNPEAHGYEFKSNHIVQTLEGLLDKFIADRTDLEKKETIDQHAYDMLMQDLDAQTAQATQDKSDKTRARSSTLQAKADANGDLQDTTNTRDADATFLNDLKTTCAQKASDFEARTQLRVEEISAIQQAISILSSAAVTGHAETYLPTLVQKRRATALVHLRADAGAAASQTRAAQYLRARAGELHSRVLSSLAMRVADDPFAKVKEMIKDLIVRLMDEANEEATHKGWCDQELATNEQTRKEKTDTVETLHAEIDQLDASIAKLTQDVAQLTAEVADLDAVMSAATEQRNAERKTNAATVTDAQEAQTAVAQAMTVLKEFYAGAVGATSFVQQQPVAPPIFESPYKGLQAENGGVIGMLEVIQSDFARLEAETHAAEAAAQKDFDDLISASKVDKAAKETEKHYKSNKKLDETQALNLKKADLEGTQKELDTALAYFDKLKPSCVDASVSYDGRVQRRKEEIESLQEALRILNGEDIAA